MKAFVFGLAAAIVIAIAAAVALNWLDRSTASAYQSGQGSVRL